MSNQDLVKKLRRLAAVPVFGADHIEAAADALERLELGLRQIANGSVDDGDKANELFKLSPGEIRKLALGTIASSGDGPRIAQAIFESGRAVDLVSTLYTLHDKAERGVNYGFAQTVWRDAANEIESLRAALLELVEANDDYINGDTGFPFAEALDRARMIALSDGKGGAVQS